MRIKPPRIELTQFTKATLLCTLFSLTLLTGCSGVLKPIREMTGTSQASQADADATPLGIGHRHPHYMTAAAKLRAPANQVYYFQLDDSTVKPEDITSIDAQANYLIKHPKARVRLEGNTDERGSPEYNIALGWRRAKAIARLMEQLGVSKKQLALVSYGEERPIAFGSNEAAWSKNRRVSLVFEAR